MAVDAGADTVSVDSLKDAAIGLSKDEVGAATTAPAEGLVNGIALVELHHQVKKGQGEGGKPTSLADVTARRG